MKKWLSTCRELFTCEDKIESVARDALSMAYSPTYGSIPLIKPPL